MILQNILRKVVSSFWMNIFPSNIFLIMLLNERLHHNNQDVFGHDTQ